MNEGSPGTQSTIAGDLNLFVHHVESLASSFPFVTAILAAVQSSANEELNKYLAAHGKVTGRSGKAINYTIGTEHASKVNRLRNKLKQARHASVIIPRNLVVALVSQFDSFLGRLIRALFFLRPEVLNAADRTLSFAQLNSFRDISDAREFIIEKEVESVLRKSHAEQFDWLENKFDIKLRVGLDAWPRFIEVTERRNLFVHSDGVVTSQYLQVCHRHNCQLDENLSAGKTLGIDEDYFREAYRCIFEIGVKLAHVLWRKLAPSDKETADRILNEISFELIARENFEMARRLLDFAMCVLKEYGSEQHRRIFLINRAQAYKWLGDQSKALEILEAEDWSASSDKFSLAVAALRDDCDCAAQLMTKLGRDGEMKKEFYEEWPVFREFRKSQPFAEAFEKIFGVKFAIKEQAAPATGPETNVDEKGNEKPEPIDAVPASNMAKLNV